MVRGMRKNAARAALLGLLSLSLVACGGSPSSTESTDKAGEQPAQEVVVDPAEKFWGEWKLASLETEGVTMIGNLEAMLDTEQSVGLSFAEDGKGTISFGEEPADLTWELVDDTTLKVTPIKEADSSDDDVTDMIGGKDSVNVTYQDDVLSMELESDDTVGTMTFSRDGTIPGLTPIEAADAQVITEADALVGEWSLSGLAMNGATVYGDKDSLAAIAGGSTDVTMVVNEDGTATVLGGNAKWSIDEEGASFSFGNYSVPVKMLGDDALIDMSEVIGGMEMVMVFSK